MPPQLQMNTRALNRKNKSCAGKQRTQHELQVFKISVLHESVHVLAVSSVIVPKLSSVGCGIIPLKLSNGSLSPVSKKK